MKSNYKYTNCTNYCPDKLNLSFYDMTFKNDLDFQSIQINVSNGTSTLRGKQLRQNSMKSNYKYTNYDSDKSRQMHTQNASGHIHSTEIVTTISRSLQTDSIILCLRKSEVSVERISVCNVYKNWESMAYTVCHAPILLTS